jgi:Fur family ferric uptake transcriptional regulator
VIDALASQDCLQSAREVADRLRGSRSGVGVATVYRALDLLDELGLVHRLDGHDGITRYEPADPSGDHHHHVVCESCGRIARFEDRDLERAIRRIAARVEHRIAAHEVVLRGRCRRCA